MRDHRLREVGVPRPVRVHAVAMGETEEVGDTSSIDQIIEVHPAAHPDAR
jgi:hypothetical protein